MPRDSRPTTISEIIRLPPSDGRDNKTWVEGAFQGVVKNARERKGGNRGTVFYTCELEDPHDSNAFVEATGDTDFTRMEGQLVEVSGSGISREEYKGKPQVKMGRSAVVTVVGAGPKDNLPRSDSRPADRSDRADRGKAEPAPKEDDRPYGPAVGNALEIASRAMLGVKDGPKPGSPEWSRLLFEVASDVYRLNLMLCKGRLADSVKDRANPEETAARKAKEEAKRVAEEAAARKAEEEAARAANLTDDPDDGEDPEDDIPF